MGGGAKRAQILAYCKAYDLSNVIVQSYQPRDELELSLTACDLSLVSLIPGSEDTVAPSKFYGILASSRPVLLIANRDSELALLIDQEECGVVVEQGDVGGLSDALLMLQANPELVTRMSERAGALYRKQFGRQQSTAAYLQLLRQYQLI